MSTATAGKRLKILFVGVGGQGALTAAKFLGEAALAAGLPVLVGQLHGMSQRGGSVECSVLIGPGESSQLGNGEADVVVGLEPLEVLRALPKMSERTTVVVNLGTIEPFTLAIQGKPYPAVDQILAQVRQVARTVHEIDGPALVKQVGVSRTLNVVMLGALAALGILPFEAALVLRAVERDSAARFWQANRLAFELGMRAAANNP
jgi:indolepyruvate ferredoxin oxidoreductase beta subunit